MAAIADVFGTLTDRRIYKPAMAPEAAIDLMKTMEGHLDQSMLRLFQEMLLDGAMTTLRSLALGIPENALRLELLQDQIRPHSPLRGRWR